MASRVPAENYLQAIKAALVVIEGHSNDTLIPFTNDLKEIDQIVWNLEEAYRGRRIVASANSELLRNYSF